ncbi:MAG TPA: metal-dependent hydrolase [Bacillota bacterium]|nr:metal-dependent hydrolase [Bacillota bacterium]
MDPITHGLTGAVVSLFDRNRRLPCSGDGEGKSIIRAITLTAMTASVLPDADFITRAAGSFAYFKYHRGPSHSLMGILILAVLLTLALGWLYPNIPRRRFFRWSLICLLLHVGFDLLNTYSTFVLWPFINRPFSLDILMIVDVIIWAIFIGGLVAARLGRGRLRPAVVGMVTALVFLLYLSTRIYIHTELLQAVQEKYAADKPVKIAVIPQMVGIRDWDYLVDLPDRFIMGTAHFPGSRLREGRTLVKQQDKSLVVAAMASDVARVVSRFSPYLYVETGKNGNVYMVKMVDLRYGLDSMLQAQIFLNRDKKVIDSNLQAFDGGSREPK